LSVENGVQISFNIQHVWYDSHGSRDGSRAGGKIEFRLVNMRLKLSPSKKMRVTAKKIREIPVVAPIPNSEVIEQLKQLLPTPENKNMITGLMKITSMDRHDMAKNNKEHFATVLEKYPHIYSYNGELVSLFFI
jgi:hypothetical protein